MAIQAAELFSRDPGRTIDLSGLSAAGIFNGLAQSVNRFSPQQAAPDMEPAAADTGSGYAPEDLFQPPAREAVMPSNPAAASQPLPDANPDDNNVARETQTDYNMDPSISQGHYGDYTDFMFESEARFNRAGKLRVYEPPPGDGGGEYEVAGITQAAEPREAATLKQMVENGQTEEATAYAKNFYQKRAEPYTSLTGNKGLQLQIADATHHRGEGGLRRILQRATGSDSKDYGELVSGLSARKDSLEAFDKARRDYEWEEVDRGLPWRRKFRQGLENRFNNAAAAARSFL